MGALIQETVFPGDMPVAIKKQTVSATAPSTSTATTTQLYYVYADQINIPRVVTRVT